MRAAIYTLGCKVNQYESDALRRQLLEQGYTVMQEDGDSDMAATGDFQPADLYIVNSCTVTHLADRKSRQLIRRLRKEAPDSCIVVTGCYAETDRAALSKIAGVDLVAGNLEKPALIGQIRQLMQECAGGDTKRPASPNAADAGRGNQSGSSLSRVAQAGRRDRAFIKIEDGCDRFCAYCIIPFARGAVRSRPADEVIVEAKAVLSAGHREIVLVGINAALYGHDVGDPDALLRLISDLAELPGDFRIRLGSLEPNVIDKATARKLAAIDKLCPHMHLALQSGSDRILKAMRRRYAADDYLAIVRELKQQDPGYGLTTDIIVGFPGETEQDFQDTLALVEKAGFLKVHAFPFSPRQGTAAAGISGRVPAQIVKERMRRLTERSDQVAGTFLKTQIAKQRRVLIEEVDPVAGVAEGYADNYIRVRIESKDVAAEWKGNFQTVELDIARNRTDKEIWPVCAGTAAMPLMTGRRIIKDD